MIINPDQIVRCLEQASFRLSYYSDVSGDTVLARRVGQSLFERICVSRATSDDKNRNRDYVGIDVECCIVPGRTGVKGLGTSDCMPLSSSGADGWTPIESESDIVRFLDELAARAPEAAEVARFTYGSELLAATGELRRAAEKYLQMMPDRTDIAACAAAMRAQATDAQRTQVGKWLKEPMVLIPHGVIWYEMASLAIALYQDVVEPQRGRFSGRRVDDREDRSLMLRMQYLASRLAQEPGWDWPVLA